jgi:hypothetical protein
MRMGVRAIATSERRTGSVLVEHRAIAAMAQHLTATLAVLRLPSLTSFEKAP